MASTATVTMVDYRIRPGQPFTVKLATALDAGVSITSLAPYTTTYGGVEQSCAANLSTVQPGDRTWSGVLYQSATDNTQFDIGANIKLSDGTSIVATEATAYVVTTPISGQAWFHVFEQSGLIPELFL